MLIEGSAAHTVLYTQQSHEGSEQTMIRKEESFLSGSSCVLVLARVRATV